MSRASIDDRRSGFTLLEVMVALALLTGALLAVAQLLVVAARASEFSRTTTVSASLAAQKLEQLRALAWGYDVDGSPIDALGLSPPGSLTGNAIGFVDYLDGAGGWIGSGTSPPPHAMFTRRWSVEADEGAAPAAVVVLRVVVLRRGMPAVGLPSGERPWTETTRLFTARARRPS